MAQYEEESFDVESFLNSPIEDTTNTGFDPDTFLDSPLGSYREEEEVKYTPVHEERGFWGDIGTSLLRGGVSIGEQFAEGLEAVGLDNKMDEYFENLQETSPYLAQDISEYYGKEGFFKRAAKGAAESVSASLGAAAPGAAVGSIFGPLGAGIGGTASMLMAFGLGTGRNEYERGIEAGLSEEDARWFGVKKGATEGLLETAGMLPVGRVAGVLGKSLKYAKDAPISSILATGKRELGKTFLKMQGAENLTEQGQLQLGNMIDQEYGLTDEGVTWNERLDTLGATIIASGALGAGAVHLDNRNKVKLKEKLNHTDPDSRREAVDEITNSMDSREGAIFTEFAEEYISKGENIPIDLPIMEAAAEIKGRAIADSDVTIEGSAANKQLGNILEEERIERERIIAGGPELVREVDAKLSEEVIPPSKEEITAQISREREVKKLTAAEERRAKKVQEDQELTRQAQKEEQVRKSVGTEVTRPVLEEYAPTVPPMTEEVRGRQLQTEEEKVQQDFFDAIINKSEDKIEEEDFITKVRQYTATKNEQDTYAAIEREVRTNPEFREAFLKLTPDLQKTFAPNVDIKEVKRLTATARIQEAIKAPPLLDRDVTGTQGTPVPVVKKDIVDEKPLAPTEVTGALEGVTSTTASPEDVLLSKEGLKEREEALTPAEAKREQDTAVSKAVKSVSNPLTKAIIEGDIANAKKYLSKWKTGVARNKRIIDAGKEALTATANIPDIETEYLQNTIRDIVEASKVSKKSKEEQKVASKKISPDMYEASYNDKIYSIVKKTKTDKDGNKWDIKLAGTDQSIPAKSVNEAKTLIPSFDEEVKSTTGTVRDVTSTVSEEEKAKYVEAMKDAAPTKIRKKAEKQAAGIMPSDAELKGEKVFKSFMAEARWDAKDALSSFIYSEGGGPYSEAMQEAHDLLFFESQWQKEEANKPNFPKNGREVLEQASLVGSAKDKWIATLARFVLTTDDEIGNPLKKIKVKPTKQGSYYYDGTIYLHPKDANSTVKLHEVVHAITTEKIKGNKKLRRELKDIFNTARNELFTEEEIAALNKMPSSNKFIKNYNKYDVLDYNKRYLYYAFINEREFLAQTFSEPQVRDALSQIAVPGDSTYSNVMQKLRAFIKKVLGFTGVQNNALERVFDMVDKLQRSNTSFSTYFLDRALPEDTTVKKTWEQVAEEDANTIKKLVGASPTTFTSKAYEGMKNMSKSVGEASSSLLGPISEELNKIDPRFKAYMRRMESKINNKNNEYVKKVAPFLRKFNELNEEDKLKLTLYLYNDKARDTKEARDILRRNNLSTDFKGIEDTLKEILRRQQEVGINLYNPKKELYVPRRVKDVEGLMDAVARKMKSKEDVGPLASIMNSEELSLANKKEMVTNIFNSGKYWEYAMKLPSSARDRTIGRIYAEFLPFYEELGASITRHISESNEKIEGRKLLGGKSGALKVQDKLQEIQNKIESNKKKGLDVTKLEEQIVEIEEGLEDLSVFTDNDISEFIAKEKDLDLTRDEEVRLVNLFRARLNHKGMTGLASDFRNVALGVALGSPMNAVTQAGDLAWTIYKNGPVATVKAIFGDKTYTKDDFDFSHALKEFGGSSAATANALDFILTKTGFQWMDKMGKEISMQASINKAKKQSPEEFAKKWKNAFVTEEKAKEVHEKIMNGVKDEDTTFFVFNDVSDFQPISLSEMPKAYLEGGNWRIFYMLKSYSIKAISNIKREITNKENSKKERAYNAAKLVTILVLANASIDEIKDIILGKGDDEEFVSDRLVDNLLNLGFMSRYSTSKGLAHGKTVKNLLTDVLVPPVNMIDAPLTDLYNMATENEDTFKTQRIIPFIGQFLYHWGPEGKEQNLKNKKNYVQEKIKESVESGDSEEYIKLVKEYNREARKSKAEPITPASIKRIKKSRLKELGTAALKVVSPGEAVASDSIDTSKLQHPKEMVDATEKSDIVKLLGQSGVEGYKEDFYIPGKVTDKTKSGATIGNGIDFGSKSRLKMKKIGIPDYLLDKLDKLGLYGKKGTAAKVAIDKIKGEDKLSPNEVAFLSNMVTSASMEDIKRKVGSKRWDTYTEDQKAVALSLYHLYGKEWYNHNSYKQFLNSEWDKLKANMEDYKDKTPYVAEGVNKRHKIMSKYL